MSAPGLIYHITTQAEWEAAQAAGAYRGDTLDSQGFIHTSTKEQVALTANRFYRGQAGLVLLEIACARVQPEIRYEAAPTGELFPHIYGPLGLDAVERVLPFTPGADGAFELPQGLA